MSFEQYGYMPVDSNKNSSIFDKNDTSEENDNSNPPEELVYEKYWYRWYIIGILALLGLVQGTAWNTWAPIDESAKAVYGFTTADLSLLTNWGPIAFIVFTPLFIWLLNAKGVRTVMVSSTFIAAFGLGLRCLPFKDKLMIITIHVAQFFNGIVGVPVMTLAPVISNLWFPPDERITATSIASLFNYMGTGVSFLIGRIVDMPVYVNSSCTGDNCTVTNSSFTTMTHQIHGMLYVEFALSALIFIATLLFHPDLPPTPPSVTATVKRLDFKAGLKSLTYKFWIIAFTFSMFYGVWGGWTGVQSVILQPLGIDQGTSGMIGFAGSMSGCVVGMITGWVTDKLGGKMKMVMVFITTLCAIAMLWFVIITENWLPFHPFKQGPVEIWCCIVAAAMFVNAGVPLSLEITADSAYPVSEMTASCVMLWLYNVFSMLLLFCTQLLPDPAVASFLVLGAFVLSVPLLQFSVSSTNNRMLVDEEGRKYSPLQPDDGTSTYISFVPPDHEEVKPLGNSPSLYGAIDPSYSTC